MPATGASSQIHPLYNDPAPDQPSPNMSVDKLKPFFDPRVSLRSAHLNGKTYGYIFGPRTAGTPNRGTILLIHGFPDLSFGWRYQIPYLQSLGLDVIAPDCMGYGRTDSPPYTLGDYTYARIASDMATLLQQLNLTSVILGGHDWGGAIAWHLALLTPSLYKAVMVICTPYHPPSPTYASLQHRVDTVLPQFGYQLHFCSGEIEAAANSRQGIKQFLMNLYGARTPSGEAAFSAEKGVNLALQSQITTPSRIISADEIEFYAQEYSRHGLRGPLNWYRTGELNHLDNLRFFFDGGKDLGKKIGIEQEALFVLATKDVALQPWMAKKMGNSIPRLTRREVEAGHWCLWEKPEEVNGFIGEWLRSKVFNEAKL
jgi:pimeloyl-ACP methyl ester carboxylesterase